MSFSRCLALLALLVGASSARADKEPLLAASLSGEWVSFHTVAVLYADGQLLFRKVNASEVTPWQQVMLTPTEVKQLLKASHASTLKTVNDAGLIIDGTVYCMTSWTTGLA